MKLEFQNTSTILLLRIFLLLSTIIQVGSAQDIYEEEFLICSGSCVDLHVFEWNSIPDICYEWKRETLGSITMLGEHGTVYSACPGVTSTYTVTALNPEGDELLGTKVFYVFVIESLNLVENNNVTSCMERRSLDYEVLIEGQNLTSFSEDIEVTFEYNDNTGAPLSTTLTSINQKAYIIIDPDLVEPDEFIHNYDLEMKAKVNVTGAVCTSNVWNTSIHTIWINFFGHNNTGKNWQIVLGDEISYSAHASPECYNFIWSFVDHWQLSHVGGKSGTDNLVSIEQSPLADQWDYFGDEFGTICVRCTDNIGIEYEVCSASFPVHINSQIRFMEPEEKVKVYFKKDQINYHEFTSGGIQPNWYYYWGKGEAINWKAIYPSLLEVLYGPDEDPAKCIYYAWTNTVIQRSFYCDRCAEDNDVTGSTGITCFHEVIAHEEEHVNIMEELWPGWPTPVGGWSGDSDDDYYPDAFEQDYINANPNQQPAPFTIGENDAFGSGDGSGYTYYEEPRCKDVERNLANRNQFNNRDWSYDESHGYHKNW